MMNPSYRRRSKVWLCFSLEGNNEQKAICRVCGVVVEESPETVTKSHLPVSGRKLWKHLEQNHKEVTKMLSGIGQDDDITEGMLNQLNVTSIQKKSGRGFTSKVWEFFEPDKKNKNNAKCLVCSASVSRGADRNTSSMWNHIRNKHQNLYYQPKSQPNAEEKSEKEPEELTTQKESIKDEFLLHNIRQNSYICKTCGMVMRLESNIEYINTQKLVKHLDHIFHKRVQHGLEPPKRDPKLPLNDRKSSNNDLILETDSTLEKLLPGPIPAEKIISDREVDLVHSGVMMHTLYMQQQRDLCCDCTILIPHVKKPSKKKIKIVKKRTKIHNLDGTIKYYETNSGYEFKVHSCVLAIASEKIKTLLDSAVGNTIMMHDVTKDAMLGFIEIAYLGKLKNLFHLEETKIWDIYLAAQSFNSKMALKYLERECMNLIEKCSTEYPTQTSLGKFSIYMPTDAHTDSADESETEKNSDDATTNLSEPPENGDDENASPSGLSLLDMSDTIENKLSNKRKRPPLSTKFRLKVKTQKIAKIENNEEFESDDAEVMFDQENDNTYDHEHGPIFQIKGDTAILCTGSPEHFTENGNGPNYTENEEIG